MIVEPIQTTHIGEEELARDRRRNVRPIHVNFLALAEIRPQPNHVALIGGNKDQLILPKEAKDRRIRLPSLVPRLDRKGEVLAIAKVEAHNRMTDPPNAPVDEEEINPAKLRQIVAPIAPAVRVVALGAVIAIANVMHLNLISIDIGPRSTRNVRTPI